MQDIQKRCDFLIKQFKNELYDAEEESENSERKFGVKHKSKAIDKAAVRS